MNNADEASENNLNSIIEKKTLDLIGIGMCRCDRDGVIRHMSQGAFKVFELENYFSGPEALHGKTVDEISGKIPYLAELHKDIFSGVSVKNYEFKFNTLDGREKWISFNSFPAGTGETEKDIFQVVIQDITGIKKTDEAIRRNERYYRALIENSLDVVAAVDVDLSVLYCSPSIERVMGFNPEEAVKIYVPDIIHPDDMSIFKEKHQRTINNPDMAVNWELRVKHKNGRWRLLEGICQNLLNDPAIKGIVVNMRDFTERKTAEDALKLSERKYREVVESASEVIYTTDFKGNFLFMNKAGRKAMEYSLEELQSKNYLDLIMPEYRRKVQIFYMRQFLDKKISSYLEYPFYTKSGKILWVGQNANLYMENDKPKGFHVIARNITERKIAENTLRESEERFRSLYENSTIGLYRTSPDGIIIMANPALVKMLGYNSVEELAQRNLEQNGFEPGYPREEFKKIIDAEGEIRGLESVWKKQDSSVIYIRESAKVIRDSKGDIIYYEGTVEDITERKTAEVALRESEARFKILFDESPVAMLEVNFKALLENLNRFHQQSELEAYLSEKPENVLDLIEKSDIVHTNKAALELYQVKNTEQLSDYFLNISSENAIKVFQTIILAAASKKLSFDEEFSIVTAKGEYRNIHIKWRVAPGSEHSFERVLISIVDITVRKRAEEERRQLEQRLQQTQKMESLSVLAGGIAHDFNNLLQAILGNASLALMDLSPLSPARESIEHVEKAALRAADLTRQMLAYSGKGRFVLHMINLTDMIEEMHHLIKASLPQSVLLKLNLNPFMPLIEADSTQIRQIILNLAANAAEAFNTGDGLISITTDSMRCDEEYLQSELIEEPLPAGEYAYIEVSDNGCGMDSDTIQKIFDPFFSTKFTGRGLGLAAVIGIVRGHRGMIKVYSEKGKGTTIKALFPAAVINENEKTALSTKEKSWQGEGTILLVDDEAAVRQVTERMLGKLGFDVILVNNGFEAVKVYKQKQKNINIVILDLTMPVMNGERTFDEIVKINPDAVVLLSSGYDEQEASERFKGKSISGFIQKPYKMDGLKDKLQKLLGT